MTKHTQVAIVVGLWSDCGANNRRLGGHLNIFPSAALRRPIRVQVPAQATNFVEEISVAPSRFLQSVQPWTYPRVFKSGQIPSHKFQAGFLLLCQFRIHLLLEELAPLAQKLRLLPLACLSCVQATCMPNKMWGRGLRLPSK